MKKQLSALAIRAIENALSAAFWYKDDLRNFLDNTFTSPSDRQLIANLNWKNYKWKIVSDFVGILCSDQHKYLDSLQQLCAELADMEDFRHLEQLEDGASKAKKARAAILELRRVMHSHFEVVGEKQRIKENIEKAEKKIQSTKKLETDLELVKFRYLSLVTSKNPQGRGFELEKVLYELFQLFDLDPKASFRNTGEQLDGAFSMDGTDYLFEAKWHQDRTAIQDLDAFAGKVRRRLENTLGLFLSINGFSPDAITAHSSGQPVLILMTGEDLTAVMEGRIDFRTLLLRKRRHASQLGEILLRVEDILKGSI
jgi:hypothetical protein